MSESLDEWKFIIEEFFNKKQEDAEEKSLKNIIKEIEKKYKENNFFDNEDYKKVFSSKKQKDEKSIDFQRNKFQDICSLNSIVDIEQAKEKYSSEITKITNKFNPKTWFDQNSKKAINISFATHISKLTHSSSKSSSIIDGVNTNKDGYLVTNDLLNKKIDGTLNNADAPIFQFLELELNGTKLVSEFLNEQTTILKSFAKDQEYLEWNKDFKEAIKENDKKADNLSKQIYFPINNEKNIQDKDRYHLLVHLKSSTMAHDIFEKIKVNNSTKFFTSVFYPQKAKIMTTQSNHGNASQLNGKRGGKLDLLNSQPPIWQSNLKLPKNKNDVFYAVPSNSSIEENLDYISDFLSRFEIIDLSIKDPKKLKWLIKWSKVIIDEFFMYIGTIQDNQPLWTKEEDIKLKIEHQFLVDPFRFDEEFIAQRDENKWQKVICQDFAGWMNKQIQKSYEKFTPQELHTKIWSKVMAKELREWNETVEFDRKQRMKR